MEIDKEDKESGMSLEYYLNRSQNETEDTDIQWMDEELKGAGIDVAGSEQRARNLIKKAKTGLKIERWKQVKRKLTKWPVGMKTHSSQNEKKEPEQHILLLALDGFDRPGFESGLDDRDKKKVMEYLMKEVN